VPVEFYTSESVTSRAPKNSSSKLTRLADAERRAFLVFVAHHKSIGKVRQDALGVKYLLKRIAFFGSPFPNRS
jgi:hypothetical protein